MATVFRRGGKGARGNRYYYSFFDHHGERITRSARTTDKSAAERIAAKHESDAALRRDGVIDPRVDRLKLEVDRSIDDHLVDFEAKLTTAGRSIKHITSTLVAIRQVCRECNMAFARDLDADAVARFAKRQLEAGKSARTVHASLTAIKQFSKWLALHQKLPFDPLASVRKPNPAIDRRRVRRMLLPEEWTRLRAATQAGKFRFRMAPDERALLYAVAIQTGLRAGELRSLTAGKLCLDGADPHVVCDAGHTKNKRTARQYLAAETAAELRALAARREPWTPLFAMPDPSELSKMLKADLADARAAWIAEAKTAADRKRRQTSDFLTVKNHAGQELDFHALRHTCGAWLARAGNHPKVVQSIMRHSSITLTMDTYGHLFPGQEAEAVATLGEFFR